MKESTLANIPSHLGPPDVRARILRNLLISVAVLCAAIVLAVNPDVFDRSVATMINGIVGRSSVLDNLVYSAFAAPTFCGVLLVSLIWFSWFDDVGAEHRARILVGTLASLGAGGASRLLQHVLPTHPRPYYDPAFHLHLPPGYDHPLNTWNSFPSDHAVVLSGLVVVIYIARSRFAVAAMILTGVVELSRIYYGAHYPSDLLGGAALASIVVWAVQAPFFVSMGQLGARWERTRPSYFYMTAFFVSYQVATLAGDLRGVASVLRAASGFARDF